MKKQSMFAGFLLALMLALSALAQTAPVATARSTVGSLDRFETFGYRDGQLIYAPVFSGRKSVDMSETMVRMAYKCSTMIAGTQHVATIEVAATVNPSLLWETEYHRLVSVYGAIGTKGGNKDFVNKDDITVGVGNYVGGWQEEMCAKANKKSLKDLLTDPSIGFAANLTELVKSDARAPFDVKVQTTRVVLPEELLRALALKLLDVPKPAAKPKAKMPVKPAPQSCCACSMTCKLLSN